MTENTEVKWTRKLNDMEALMCKSIEKKFMIIRYVIKLCSKKPLEEKDFKNALINLQRKVPTLRLCIREREHNELWFVLRDNEELDYEIGETSDYEKVHEEILYQQFNNSNGPLWRSRLFPSQPDELCPLPELQNDFPHYYNLLLAFHHSITDGTSNIKICNLFIEIFNDVIAGKDIEDDQQLGHHMNKEELFEEVKQNLMNNKDEMKSLIKFIDYKDTLDLKITKAYPSNNPTVSKTKTIYRDLTVSETDTLIKKCKSEGVTVNSAISTAINCALIELVQKAGIVEETYLIPILTLVNLRRYFNCLNATSPLGLAIGWLTQICKINSDIKDQFWSYSRTFQNEVNYLLKEKQVIKEELVHDYLAIDAIAKLFSDDINEVLNYIYFTSSLGLLNFKGEGEHVQAYSLARCTSLQKFISGHEIHTFRGRLQYSLDYGSEYISDEGAQLWCDAIFRILKETM